MHSIQTKITAVTITAIILSILFAGGIGITALNRVGNADSTREITLISENRRQTLNEYMTNIEQSVNMVAHYAVEELDSVRLAQADVIGADGYVLRSEVPDKLTDGQRALNGYLYSYSSNVKNVFQTVANHTPGVITYYYRMNSQISRQEQGFLVTRINTPAFVENPVTDLYAFEEDDTEHVGWYYTPLKAGHPVWMGPYYNDNLNVSMFSYIVPIYKTGTFMGVIGMDIDYNTIVDQIKGVSIYKTGYACLTDSDGVIVYHPTLESGHNVSTVDERLTSAIQSLSNNSASEIVEYSYEGVEKKAACTTLENGLKLIVTVPLSEINSVAREMANKVILLAILIVLCASLFITSITRRIVLPLRRLTDASVAVMNADYDVDLNYRVSNDEVGILTNAFQHLVDHLKIHISDLNSKAYKDSLTSVRNKAGYEIFTRKINDQISNNTSEEALEFAVIMFDCNDLKEINDTYGHEKGDVYLQNSCRTICRTFVHSPVFRIGGDEFVAILQGEDYEHREERFRDFMKKQEEEPDSIPPWERMSVAGGMAVFEPGKDQSLEEVLKRADKLMYENKKMWHDKSQRDVRPSVQD